MATPKLRFKEFNGDWFKKSLCNFASKKNLKNRDGVIAEVLTNSATQGIIKQSGYFDREIVTESNLHGYFVVDVDDFVYNPRISAHAPVGPIKRNHQCLGVMSPLYTVFTFADGDLNFYEYFFESEFWHDYVKNVSNSGARHDRMNIGNKDFFNMPMHLPSLEEQTKIASFLSAVDEKISQLTQKHELLSQYKQGMMQKLFSQQIRFKADDGSEFGEWEEKPLNEISSKQSSKNKDDSITEVLTNSATQGIIKQSDYFEREIVTESNLNGYYIVNLDDFVYNPRISVHAPVGPIKRNKKCLGVMSPLYTVFTVKEGNLMFLEYFFESNFWHDYVKSVANSGARHDRMNITNKDFFEMPVLYPCLEEQTKIANFLSSIDQKIEVVAQQIEQAKQWKKGLLQQMFV